MKSVLHVFAGIVLPCTSLGFGIPRSWFQLRFGHDLSRMTQSTVSEGEEDVLFDEDDENQGQQKNNDSSVEARYTASPLTLTVFKRETGNGVFRNFNLQRTYPKDDRGESFGHTSSLRPRDLRKAASLLRSAADDIEGVSVEKVENNGGGQ